MLVPGIDSKRMRPFLRMSTTNSSVAALTIPIAAHARGRRGRRLRRAVSRCAQNSRHLTLLLAALVEPSPSVISARGLWPGNCSCLSELSIPTGLAPLASRVCAALAGMQAREKIVTVCPFVRTACLEW